MSNDLEYSLGLDIGPFETAKAATLASTKKYIAEVTALFNARDRLTDVTAKSQLERSAGFRAEIILQREILGLRQNIAQIDGVTQQKLEMQIQLEQKILQLEKMISAERATSSARVGGGSAGGAAGGVGQIAIAARDADGALKKVGDTMGKLVSVGNVLKSALSTLGIAMLAPFASDWIARTVTGVTKAEEEGLNRIAELSAQVADKRLAFMRSKLSDEQRYHALLEQQERLENRIAANRNLTTADQVKLQEDQLAIVIAETEAAAALEKIESARTAKIKERGEAAKKWFADQARQREEIARAEEKQDAARKKALQESYDLQQKGEAERLSTLDKNIERLTLEAKQVHGLTVEEKARLEVLRLIAKQLEIEQQIRTLLSLDKRTPQEDSVLQSLFRQNTALDTQRAEKERMLAGIRAQQSAEAGVTAELAKQQSTLAAIVQQITGIAGIRGFDQFENASEDTLRETLRRNQQQLAALERQRAGSGAQVGGDISYNLERGRLQSEVENLRRELQFRADFERSLRNGEDNARRNFAGDPLAFDEVLSRLTGQFDAQDETNELLTDIRRSTLATAEALKNARLGGG